MLTAGTQKVKWWFYHHATPAEAAIPEPAPISLLQKRLCKVVRLTPYQAYSRLFCQKDTALHTEIHEKWAAFTAHDGTEANTTAVTTYGHLFPNREPTSIKFLVFQQALIRDMLPTVSEDELRQVEEYIEKRFREDTDRRDHPWQALKVNELQTDADLEKQYNER